MEGAVSEDTVDVQTLAEMLRLTPRRIQQLAREGQIPKASRGRYPLIESVRGYVDYLNELAAKARQGAEQLVAPKLRKETALAELAELELAEKRRETIPRAETERFLVALFSHVRTRIRGVPRKAAPPAHAAESVAEVEEIFWKHLSEALEQLSDTKIQLPDSRRSPSKPG